MDKETRIVIVDDEQADCDIISELLSSEGYHVSAACTGKDGLRLIREIRPNLVLLDVHLPDISGIEVCRQIKTDDNLKDVFVVFFSGEMTSISSQIGGLETGADDYLLKGLETGILRARIQTALRLQGATKALRASEEQFRQLAENIREVFWMTDLPTNELIYVSPAYETIWGRSCKSLYNSPRSWLQSIHPADRDRITEAIPAKQISGDYNEEYRIVRPDGALVWIHDRAFPIRDESGSVCRIAGIAEDITKRKQSEEALRESESRQRAVREAALDGIITFEPSGKIIEMNSAAERIFGCGRALAIGRDICEVIVPPSLREWFTRGLDNAFVLDEGPVLDGRVEMSMLRSDGLEFPAECTITRINLIGPPLFTAFIRDNTRRKQAEARASMLAHAVESTTEPICITDLQDRFIFINRAFEKTYGYSSDEILGKSPEILFSRNNPPSLLAQILEQSRFGGWRGEVLDKKKDGTEFPVSLSTSLIANERGRVIGLLGVAQDITERKRAEEKIQLLVDAVQSAQDFISITDSDNHFIFVNRAILKATGYREDEMMGKTPEFLYSPRNPPALCETVLRRTREDSWQGKVVYRRKDGSEFVVELHTANIRDNQGRPLGLICVAKDISERLWAERQQAALSQLAHRLNATFVPEEAAQVIFNIAKDLFSLDAGYVGLHSPTEDRNIFLHAIDTVDGEQKLVPPTTEKRPLSPLMRLIMKDGKRLINRSDEASLPINLMRFGNMQRRSESRMYVPIRHLGFPQGVLSIQSYTPNAYGGDDLELLQVLADHCGSTLQRIRLTEALRQAEANYRSIFESATHGIFRSTSDGRILEANPALARIFGYDSPDELMSAVHDLAREVYARGEQRAEFERLLATKGQVREFEVENFRKDGSKIWASLNAHVVRDAEGAVKYYEGTLEDITERKRAQRHLADALELNQTILASSSLGILAYLATGECVFANEAAGRIFHTTIEELLKQNFRCLKSWQQAGLHELAEKTLRTRKVQTAEGRFVAGSGEMILLDWRFASFLSGGEWHLLALADDITVRKHAEEELRRLPQRIIEAGEAERQRVARDLHDGVNQLIAAAKVKLSKVQASVAASSPATAEILSRCSDLLVEALEENRRVAHNLRPSDLDEFGFIAACRNFCNEFRARTHLAVRCRIKAPGLRLPPATELNLFRIVQETFNNIEKHARATAASLEISSRQDFLVLQIRDNGCGFDPKRPPNRRKKRRGFGLTNIRERAAFLGGSCTVESAPIHGTTFTIRVPLGETE